jgi:hypothetical protein
MVTPLALDAAPLVRIRRITSGHGMNLESVMPLPCSSSSGVAGSGGVSAVVAGGHPLAQRAVADGLVVGSAPDCGLRVDSLEAHHAVLRGADNRSVAVRELCGRGLRVAVPLLAESGSAATSPPGRDARPDVTFYRLEQVVRTRCLLPSGHGIILGSYLLDIIPSEGHEM